MDVWKNEVKLGALEESASPVLVATLAMHGCNTATIHV